jgi:hypothetical protein
MGMPQFALDKNGKLQPITPQQIAEFNAGKANQSQNPA